MKICKTTWHNGHKELYYKRTKKDGFLHYKTTQKFDTIAIQTIYQETKQEVLIWTRIILIL